MESLKKFLEERDWKYFENFIAEVFERFNYKISKNVRIKFLNYKEFDLIAKKQNKILLIECKKWKKEYSKFKNVRREIEKFKEKFNEYKKYQINKKIFGLMIFLNATFQPIREENIFVLSIDFLNTFLNEFENLYF
ncbi:MAG: NERD domain-containing protein [Candidatus Aenigmatarchaeota archaeon]